MGKRRPWSDLPAELGGLVLGSLLCFIDRLRFRAVCRQWRLAAQQQQLPPALPLLLSQRTFRSIPGGERLRFMPVPGNLGRCCGCFDGWLLFLRRPPYERNHRTCFLVNPTFGATITTIPLCFDVGRPMAVFPMTKVVVCSPDLVAATIGHDSSVAFYRPGAAAWSACAPDPCKRGQYVDIALHRGRLYALNGKEELFAHELGGGAPPEQLASRAVRRVVGSALAPARRDAAAFSSMRPRYLVVSRGKLLMVKWSSRHDDDPPAAGRCPREKKKGVKMKTMKVLEADLEMGRWLEVDDLNGEALFVSPGSSRALAGLTGGQMFQGNRIYFPGHDLDRCGLISQDKIPVFGFYDLRSGIIGSQVFLEEQWSFRDHWGAQWFFP